MTQRKCLAVVLSVILVGSVQLFAQTASSQPSSAPVKVSTQSAVLPSASAAPAASGNKAARTQSATQSGKLALASEAGAMTPKQARATVKSGTSATVKTTTTKNTK